MAAAKSGLYVFGAQASSGDETPVPKVFPWYDVARARWEGGGRTLRAGVGGPGPRGPGWAQQGDPDEFMRQVSEYVNRSIVMHVQTETDAGTTITGVGAPGPRRAFLGADGGRSAGR